jgi:hypothetical protein
VRNQEQMQKLGYPSPDGNYFVYSLQHIPRKFEPLDLRNIIEVERIAEMERRRKAGILKEGWEDEWRGTPIFKTGEELLPFRLNLQSIDNL